MRIASDWGMADVLFWEFIECATLPFFANVGNTYLEVCIKGVMVRSSEV